MRSLTIIASLAAFLAAMFILYQLFVVPGTSDASLDSDKNNVVAQSDAVLSDTNAVVKESEPASTKLSGEQVSSAELTDGNSSRSTLNNYPELFAYEIGHEALPDAEFLKLIARLRNDPQLLADLMNEVRAEADPTRLKRLIFILGETASSDVLPLSEELIYSGNADSRAAGLDLLSRIAPHNPEAFTVANNILGGETEPDVLVATMNVLTKPGGTSPEIRESLVAQITPLANHETPAVRRHSISILTRLSNDASLSPMLYSALSDTDSSVREAAVYAYAGYPYQTPEAVDRLMSIVEDESESKGVRRGAILAIRKMSPDEAIEARLTAASKQMRQRVRRQ